MDKIAAVLFDIDGTLVDSTYLHTTSWWQAFRQFDLDIPMARIHRTIGMGSDHILDELLGEDHDRSNDDTIAAAHTALQAANWPRLRRTPGAKELMTTCAGRGLRVVLASSASGDELAALRKVIDADDVIDTVTTAEDAESTKPDADIVLVALRKAGLEPAQAIFVGDAVWDVYAATKAGLPCITVTCGGTSEAELRKAGAVDVRESPAAYVDYFG